MKTTYEMIKFENTLPINVLLHSVGAVANHWHSSIEILFVLSGTVEIIYDGKKYILKKDSIFVINSNKIHSLSADSNNSVIMAQIEYDFIKNVYKDIDNIEFDCIQIDKSNNLSEFDIIRHILAKIVWIYNKCFDGYQLKINSLLFELVYILVNNFKVEKSEKSINLGNKHFDRLVRIMDYVKENFNNDISLSKVAEIEFLTPQYLSRFFEKHMGINFSTYVSKVRLEYAVNELINSDDSITDIAFNSGFPNVKSFISFFKSNYHETPNSYRKKIKELNKSLISDKGEKITQNYLDVDTNNYFKEVFTYLKEQKYNDNIENMERRIRKKIEVDLSKNISEIKNNWKNLMTIGKAKEGLLDTVQNQIREVQANIGFRYIRFHGIFDDEMMVYKENEDGTVEYNFHYVDRLFDFLKSVNLKPFVELSFMPSALAKYKTKTLFYNKSVTSPPKSYKKWAFMINEFVRHCIDRYGLEEVRSWYFEVWNEPDIKEFWFGSEEEYYDLYEITYKVIKEIDESIRVGGPSISSMTIKQTKWLERYIKYCIDNKCEPDFISFHTYPNEVFNIEDDFSHKKGLMIDENINYLSDIIDMVKNKLSESNLNNVEIFLTEWNSTISHRDLTNDTLYKSSYIVKNILENMDKVNGFGYWAMSDHIEEFIIDKHIFHGGLGIITHNNIKKSAYYAFKMLNKLGQVVVDKGDGYYITKDFKGYTVYLYNYCHFDKIYCMSDVSNISIKERYNVFIDKIFNIDLKLSNFEKDGNYNVTSYSISKEHGSSFDTWINMGAPDYLDSDDIEYINNTSVPYKRKFTTNIDKEFIIKEELNPHEVKVYSFVKSYR